VVLFVVVTEKRRPSYDLRAIKSAFSGVDRLNVTGSALRGAAALGYGRRDMVEVIQGLQPRHFYKSMTSFADHRQWQDVYHAPSDQGLLYVKFTADAVTEFLLLSFKEKGND